MKREFRKFKFTFPLMCIVILTSVNSNLLSQDVSQYFDDSGLSEIKSIIKTGYDPVNGEIPICFEHKLLNNISVEAGLSLVSLKKQFGLHKNRPIPGLKETGWGFSTMLNFKAYIFKDFYEGFYGSTGVKFNFFDKTYFDVNIVNFGWQFSFSKKIVADLTLGGGWRFFKYISNPGTIAEYEDSDAVGVVTVQIKAGYAF